MSGLESDTVGGFNAMLARQKEADGQVIVTTVLFSDESLLLHDRIDIRGVEAMTSRDYQVGGCTALLDAIGLTISKIGNAQKYTSEEQRAARVMIVITTDGLENASRKYTLNQVRRMIERQKEKFKWEFIFLGANMDAIDTAASFGIRHDRAATFRADGSGVLTNFACVSETLSDFCAGKTISDDWKK